jgi:hypothetical protein
MKKLVLGFVFCAIFIFGANVKAETVVSYNIAGHPVRISHGAGPAVLYTTYQNRLRSNYDYRPSRPARRHVRNNNFPRGMNPRMGGNHPNNMVAQNKPQEISRFDRNYTPRRQTSYTKRGITYYN